MRYLKFAKAALAMGFCTLGASSVCLANPGLPPNAPVREELTLDGYIMQTPSGMALYYDDAARVHAGFGGIGPCPDKPSTMTDDKESGMGPRPIIAAKLVKACTEKWRPFMAAAGAQPVGDFTLVDRPEGKQWAWMGRPLFTSVKDKKPGDRNGSFTGGKFLGGQINPMALARLPEELPAGLKLALRDEGLVITTSNGKALYTPKKGSKPDERFEPVVAPAMASLGSPWSVVSMGDRKQYAFNGKPLYALSAQTSEGDIDADGGWESVVYYASGRPPEIGRLLTLDGEVYTDKNGHTLYTYSCNSGSPNRVTIGVTCDDPGDPAAYLVPLCGSAQDCAQRWKPYLARDGAKPTGLWSVVDVTYPLFTDPNGVIDPPDAPHVKAWAYRGHPVFTTPDDEKPGDTRGDNTYGLWGGGVIDTLQVPGREVSE